MEKAEVNVSFYVLHDGNKSCFPTWREALEGYRALPWSAEKTMGTSHAEQDLNLIRCLASEDGENVLVMDFLELPYWKNLQEGLIPLVEELVSALDIRRCLIENQLVPASVDGEPSRVLEDKYLWPNDQRDISSSVRWIHVRGVGWISPTELKRRFPAPDQNGRYPSVTRLRADGVTEKGAYAPLELSYWEYRLLERRTRMRLSQNRA